MTIEEALQQIDNYGLLDEETPQELRDAVNVLCGAAEKQIPQKPIWKSICADAEIDDFQKVCPVCDKPIVNVWSLRHYNPNYCHNCGQALDFDGE